ncbi:hypothetical protein F5880DRAFT_1159630 [Lentinula raphanica]|nr:hypothetical protein F5880DRAFT_1159630 [Lentinula raphanica]
MNSLHRTVEGASIAFLVMSVRLTLSTSTVVASIGLPFSGASYRTRMTGVEFSAGHDGSLEQRGAVMAYDIIMIFGSPM